MRVIALGASNLTRGFHTVVSAARSAYGQEVEILAALGHGRSYGATSVLAGVRGLPGILESGLWKTLSELPGLPSRALLTDVGNDILYGYSVGQILDWVGETASRLHPFTDDILLTGLPLASIRQLSPARFLFFRSILVPRCRLSLATVLERAEEVQDGLAHLAESRGLRFISLRPDWYGVDPIHIRPALWDAAWREILFPDGRAPTSKASLGEGARLYLTLPERSSWLGFEVRRPQKGLALRAGGRVWLY